MAKIHKSLEIGQKGQELVRSVLATAGIDSLHNEEYAKREHFDVVVAACPLWPEFTIEVKYDLMSARTGNLAIEFYNSKSVKASGIEVTQSNIWAHVLPDGSVWFCNTAKLLEFSRNEKPLRIVYGGGDDNADLKLYEKTHILEIFTKVNGLGKQQLIDVIKGML